MNIIRLTALCFLFFGLTALAQTTTSLKNKAPFPTKYTSLSDQALVIKAVTVAPVYDNSNNIYKKSVEEHLKNLIKDDYFWALSDFNSPKKDMRVDEFDEDASLTLQVLDKSQADAVLTCFLIKGPQGLNIQMNLYTRDGGKLLLREDYQSPTLFEISKVNETITKMYSSLKAKLPYSGYVTSRSGNAVTVNLGKKAGLSEGAVLTVAQVLKINRHPKLNFMTSVEKEIIGRITLTKVESDSSFGEISFEKENGVIDRGSKILPLEGIKYPSKGEAPLAQVLPNEKNAVEWLPTPTPQYGKISLMGGFTNFTDNTVLVNGTSIEADKSLALSFALGTELWITPEYFGSLELQQTSFKTDNNLPTSTPNGLNYTLNKMDLAFGYKYLIDGNFWGPQISASVGYYTHSVRVTDTTPTAFTSFDLSGFDLTVGGMFPVSLKNDVAIGAQAKFLFFENLSEKPVSSGGASPSFNQFDVLGSYQYTTNISFKGLISLANVQATFTGTGSKNPPSRSLDEKISTYLVGIEYLF
ncbi:hypothetical protein CIK05_00600 [Bdellovibrio sp. qaytius]|nr:hypothetical protein CIK05_00600 [Bdellovibrio sp. qaytius]